MAFGNNIPILILDDNTELLDIVQLEFKRQKVENFMVFHDEDKFIEALGEGPSICIIDHWLTKRTGLDILKIVRAKNEYSFFIALSDLADIDIRTEYLNNDCNRWVEKSRDLDFKILSGYLSVGLEKINRFLGLLNQLEIGKRILTQS